MFFAGAYVVNGWLACDGALYSVTDYPDLFELIGFSYGGNGTNTFAVPDLRGKSPLGSLGQYQICNSGVGVGQCLGTMGELRLLAYPLPSEAAVNWLTCAGQFEPVSRRQALFFILGNSYGGNGSSNFQLPDLTAKVPLPQTSYVMCVSGTFPDLSGETGTARDLLGSIRIFCGPTGGGQLLANHLPCTGGTLPLRTNTTLFTVIGNSYGGDGSQNFKLPNLAGLSPAEVRNNSELVVGAYLICNSGFYPARS